MSAPETAKVGPAGWDQAVDSFVDQVEGTVSPRTGEPVTASTVTQYAVVVRRFGRELAVGPWEVGQEQLEAWLGAPGSESMVRGRRAALSAFYSWALRHGHVASAPLSFATLDPVRDLPHGWGEALDAFEEHLKTATSPVTGQPIATATRRTHLVYLKRLARTIETGPLELDVDELTAWVGEQDLRSETSQRLRQALQLFFSWSVATGRRSDAPLELPRAGLGEGWHDAVEKFAAWLATTPRTPATRAGYVRHVAWLASRVEAGPGDLGAQELGDWFGGQRWSQSTRRSVLTSLRIFYAWAVEHGVAEWSPVAGLESSEHTPRRMEKLRFTAAWEEPAWAFMAWMRSAKRLESTIEQRRRYLRMLSESAADPWAVTTRQLELWLANADWSPSAAHSARSTVREFYRWAELDQRVERSPAERLQSIRQPRHLPRPVPDEPLRVALLDADDRTRLILMFGALAGLRRAEIAALHTRHVTRDAILVSGKAGHERQVPMHPLLWEEISAELERRKRGTTGTGWGGAFCTVPGFLFPSGKRPGPMTPAHLGKLASRALPDHWASHGLRHRFATLSYAHERDILAVQQLLGHSKPETTSVYAGIPEGATKGAVHSLKLL